MIMVAKTSFNKNNPALEHVKERVRQDVHAQCVTAVESATFDAEA